MSLEHMYRAAKEAEIQLAKQDIAPTIAGVAAMRAG
jgi:hypothetical protein